MKRILYIICMLIGVASLASCQKESLGDAPYPFREYATLTYQIGKEVFFDIKAGSASQGGNASAINVLWYGVYHKKQLSDGTYTYIYMSDMSDFVEIDATANLSNIQVPITLIKNQEYKLVFVAQHRFKQTDQSNYTYIYNIDYGQQKDQAIMKLNQDQGIAVTNGEWLDAFVAVDPVGPVVGNENKHITLKRPFAQINISTSATVNEVTLSGVPASYNLFTSQYSEQTTSHTFNGLTTLYVFGGNKINCAIKTNSNTKTITGIPTAPNFKTNIVGNI